MHLQKGVASILLILFMISLSILVFAVTRKVTLQSTTSSVQNNNIKPTPEPWVENCSKYGITKNKDELYLKYTVKSGDTLLSIAKKELGDTTRAGDLVYINRDEFPGLSLQNPFLEVGWTLHLPPDFFKHVQATNDYPYLLYGAYGEMIQMNGSIWTIKLDQLNLHYDLHLDSQTQYIGKTRSDFKIGNCVKAIMVDFKVLTINSQ